MPPPQLTRDAPGFDVIEPVEIDLFFALWDDLDVAVADGIKRWPNDLGRVDEPLVGEHGLDDNLRAVPEGLHDGFGFDEGHRDVRLFARGAFAAEAWVACGGHDG